MELKTKLELANKRKKEVIERKIKEVEYELAYLEMKWMYE